MNERIRELAHKADFIIKKNNGAEWRWGHIDPELAEKLEKFAELIVRECTAQIAEAIPDTDCSASGAYKTAKIAAMTRVKEHFGVEE
jgi:hypothetical protein